MHVVYCCAVRGIAAAMLSVLFAGFAVRSRRCVARVVALAAALCIWHGTASVAAAPDSALQLRLVPDQIALQPGADRQTVILLAPRLAALTVQDAKLEVLAGPGVTVAIKSQPSLPTQADLAWTMEVTADARAAKETLLLARVDYRLRGEKPGEEAIGTAAATAKIAYTALSVAQAIKATIHPGFETLQAGRSAVMFLAIENSGLEDVTLDQISLDGVTLGQTATSPPKSLSENIAAIEPVQLPVTIRGRDTGWIRIGIKVSDYIVPSARPLPLELAFSRGQGAQRQTGTLTLADKVTFGIAGLSDINTALQIPSVFILPGLLVVATWSVIWTLLKRAQPQPPSFPLSARGLEFYIVAITISLLTAYVYPRLTGRSSEMLDRISLVDIGWIWFGSIFFVAPLTYAIGALVSWWRRRSKEKEEAKRQQELAAAKASANPQAGDGPLDTLIKLAHAHGSLSLEAFQVPGLPALVYALGYGETSAADSAWVAPAIVITVEKHENAFAAQVDDARDNDDINSLVKLLTANKAKYKIKWEGGAAGAKIREFARKDLNDARGRQSFIQRK